MEKIEISKELYEEMLDKIVTYEEKLGITDIDRIVSKHVYLDNLSKYKEEKAKNKALSKAHKQSTAELNILKSKYDKLLSERGTITNTTAEGIYRKILENAYTIGLQNGLFKEHLSKLRKTAVDAAKKFMYKGIQ